MIRWLKKAEDHIQRVYCANDYEKIISEGDYVITSVNSGNGYDDQVRYFSTDKDRNIVIDFRNKLVYFLSQSLKFEQLAIRITDEDFNIIIGLYNKGKMKEVCDFFFDIDAPCEECLSGCDSCKDGVRYMWLPYYDRHE